MRGLMRLAASLMFGALSVGCVEPFEGSHIEMLLRGGTQVAGDPGGNARPPSDTHYEIWVQHAGLAFHLFDFNVFTVIDRANPCFIEDSASRYPGLHSTMILEKELFEAGAPNDVSPEEAGIIADAQTRVVNQESLERELKGVTSHQPVLRVSGMVVAYPDLYAALGAVVPAPEMIDDASNAARATACQAFFDENPDFYVGNDKVFSLPLNGKLYGMVDGVDPRNSAFVGGAGFDVPQTFREFDSLMINWQFNDPDDPRATSFGPCPMRMPGEPCSPIGYHYMAGVPQNRTRRVITIPVRNTDFGNLTGDVAVYPGIDDDQVQF